MLAMKCFVLAVGFLLLWSGWIHIVNQHQFFESIKRYDILHPALGLVVAATLPAVQIIIGLCLFFDKYMHTATTAAALLFGVFTAGQLTVLVRGQSIPCGCFGLYSDRVTILSMSVICAISIALFVLTLFAKHGSRNANSISYSEPST